MTVLTRYFSALAELFCFFCATRTCTVTGWTVTWPEAGVVFRWAWYAVLSRLSLLVSLWIPLLYVWRRLRGTVVDNSTGRVVCTPSIASRLVQLFTSSLSSFAHFHFVSLLVDRTAYSTIIIIIMLYLCPFVCDFVHCG